MERSSIIQDTIEMMSALEDDDLLFANKFIKKLVLAWDPDFTRLTVKEREELEEIRLSGDYSNTLE